MRPTDWTTAAAVLRLAAELIDTVQDGVAARGFPDVRPAHGFAFVRIAAGHATTSDVAAHLGVTKQSAAELVTALVDRGYVTREPDPRDARARLLRLTPRGQACTVAAEEAAADAVADWRARLGAEAFAALEAALASLALPGPLRPSW
ncbi:MarR family winged helix-turn-helix transcriptional regulator [Trujillonella endophytica]|uniref:DNA-binding transcriptional regulator, MarR family n=1 Tax=Trujillonella endophytica TaxID=673521 RepID=A0A1H8PDK5_9ACTN|nr:MarR family winged helix-turn-helix transcriptional regulator [Trujillella endophytica]SEO39881.1 DNA-binding transcriptional regulator, MarR family [Trujillella endophytica]